METTKKPSGRALFLFLFPIITAAVIFAVLNVSCQRQGADVSGKVTILYTSDVGGALDPCG